MTTPTDQTIVSNTLALLGGRRFLTMTGAKVLGSGTTLVVQLPRRTAKNGITHCLFEYLPGTDLYGVTFERRSIRNGKLKQTIVHAFGGGLFGEQLAEIFEHYTGLYTSLRPRN